MKHKDKFQYNTTKHSALNRGLQVCSKDDFQKWASAVPDKCWYCEIDPKQSVENAKRIMSEPSLKRFREIYRNKNFMSLQRLTIDRKNPDGGYTVDNMVKCCWPCNYIKGGVFNSVEFGSVGMVFRMKIENRI